MLRPSSPPLCGRASPRGKPWNKAINKISIENGLCIICYAPHHRRYAAELPPGGKPWNKAINKISIGNGLRLICYAPHHRRYAAELPPRGKPWNKAINKISIGKRLRLKCCAPHPSAKLTPSPRGEALEQGDNFKIKRFATVRS